MRRTATIMALWSVLLFSRANGRAETPGSGLRRRSSSNTARSPAIPEPFRELLDRFEHENPGIRVKDETLPASTDEQHQFYAINLEGKSADFDVLSMDVIWVPEFARAGWLRDVSPLLGRRGAERVLPRADTGRHL